MVATGTDDRTGDAYHGVAKEWSNVIIPQREWKQDTSTLGTFLTDEGSAGKTKYNAVSFTGSTSITHHLSFQLPVDLADADYFLDCVFVTAATASNGTTVWTHRANVVDVLGKNTTGEAFDALGTLGTAINIIPSNYATRPVELVLPLRSTIGGVGLTQAGDILHVALRRRAYGVGARSNDNRMNMIASRFRYKRAVDNNSLWRKTN